MSEFDAEEQADYARAAELAYRELVSRQGEGAPQPRLEPTRRVVELLGDVHRSYPVIHVAGTNGKTSTSRMIESILRAYSLRTGLFTSPHLTRFNERIMIDGEPIRNDALVANWLDVKPYIELVDKELEAKGEPRLTYFEALTVLAFASFADAPVDVAIIEVGMGGEWDSTNVADGAVAVFTPIDLDHTDNLGDTIEAIARTKSGIIKPSAFVVSAAQSPEALEVLREATTLTESPLYVVGEHATIDQADVAVGGQLISVTGISGTYPEIYLSLLGDHQSQNAALAILAVEAFLGGGDIALDPDVLAEAFGTVTSPGRLQIIATEPTVLVDAAHNPHGARALAEALTSYFTFDDITLVIGVLDDKDAAGILENIAPHVDRIIVTTAPSERARDADEIRDLAVNILGEDRVLSIQDPTEAIARAREFAAQHQHGAVVVTGSITLVGLAVSEAELSQGWSA